jgi:hypothetical protein
MIFGYVSRTYLYDLSISVHYDYRGGQSNFECSYKAKIKSIVSMYIGQGVSLEARYAAQAERRAANTAMAQASASAAAAAERASSASPTCLSPTAEMDSIASPPPTGASADCPSGASTANDLTGSLVPLVNAKDFYLKQNRSVCALVVLCHSLMHDDGTPAIDLLTAPSSMMKKSVLKVSSKEYQSEKTRRWNIMCAYDPDLKANCRWGIPRTNQWKLEKLQMWLNDNPVTDDGERAYLLDAVNERIGASTMGMRLPRSKKRRHRRFHF